MQYLLTLSYVGTRFCGFQVQHNGISIQSTVQDAIESLCGTRLDVKGCSRTDAGVHAKEYKLSFAAELSVFSVPVEKIPAAMNRYLPTDICVMDACIVDDSFHVRYDVKEKEYEYLILNTQYRDPFCENLAWHVPAQLNTDRMNQSARYLIGCHDFSSFMAAGSSVEDTVREIKSISVTRDGKFVKIKISADGFLYHMVRIIAGTLCDAGLGKIEPENIIQIMESNDRKNAGRTAPAHGLYLVRVSYQE